MADFVEVDATSLIGLYAEQDQVDVNTASLVVVYWSAESGGGGACVDVGATSIIGVYENEPVVEIDTASLVAVYSEIPEEPDAWVEVDGVSLVAVYTEPATATIKRKFPVIPANLVVPAERKFPVMV
jgi:hypothetical protein